MGTHDGNAKYELTVYTADGSHPISTWYEAKHEEQCVFYMK